MAPNVEEHPWCVEHQVNHACPSQPNEQAELQEQVGKIIFGMSSPRMADGSEADLWMFTKHGSRQMVEAIMQAFTAHQTAQTEQLVKDLMNAYEPGIEDLELDELQGKERPVIYRDTAIATIKSKEGTI